MGHYNFDLDLPEGIAGERLTREILTEAIGKVEVKRDSKVSETGNIAVEFFCRGRKSGIAVSTADWWAFVLDGYKYDHQIVIFIKRSRLLEIAREYYRAGKWVNGGDEGKSRMVLIPLKELVSWSPQHIKPELI